MIIFTLRISFSTLHKTSETFHITFLRVWTLFLVKMMTKLTFHILKMVIIFTFLVIQPPISVIFFIKKVFRSIKMIFLLLILALILLGSGKKLLQITIFFLKTYRLTPRSVLRVGIVRKGILIIIKIV